MDSPTPISREAARAIAKAMRETADNAAAITPAKVQMLDHLEKACRRSSFRREFAAMTPDEIRRALRTAVHQCADAKTAGNQRKRERAARRALALLLEGLEREHGRATLVAEAPTIRRWANKGAVGAMLERLCPPRPRLSIN